VLDLGGDETKDHRALLAKCEQIWETHPELQDKLINLIDKTVQMYLGCDPIDRQLVELCISRYVRDDKPELWIATMDVALDAALAAESFFRTFPERY
jgi:hypothetical protein